MKWAQIAAKIWDETIAKIHNPNEQLECGNVYRRTIFCPVTLVIHKALDNYVLNLFSIVLSQSQFD